MTTAVSTAYLYIKGSYRSVVYIGMEVMTLAVMHYSGWTILHNWNSSSNDFNFYVGLLLIFAM